MVNLEALTKLWKEQKQIKCPFFLTIQANDDGQYPVTYHGESGPEEYDCDSCLKTFFVEELVVRTFEVTKTQ